MKNVLSVAAVSLAVTAVFALSVTPAFAESSKKLTDDADIITSSQEETIENNLKKCTLATGWDTIIYTNNNNVDSYDMEDYCNDYFDNHDYGCGDKKSGVMLTIDMSSREMYNHQGRGDVLFQRCPNRRFARQRSVRAFKRRL